MTLTLIQPAAADLISAAELGDHLRLAFGFDADAGAGSADDASLARAVQAAIAVVERSLSTALMRQGWAWRITHWPLERRGEVDLAPFPISPVLSVTSVAMVGDDGAETAWSADAWRLDQSGVRPALRSLSRSVFPIGLGGAVVRFDAGYGDAPAAVPPDLRHAVLLLAAHYFERRAAAEADAPSEIPHGVERLLAAYRPVRF